MEMGIITTILKLYLILNLIEIVINSNNLYNFKVKIDFIIFIIYISI